MKYDRPLTQADVENYYRLQNDPKEMHYALTIHALMYEMSYARAERDMAIWMRWVEKKMKSQVRICSGKQEKTGEDVLQ